MAIIAFDAAGGATGSTGSLSFSHTCTGSNLILFCFVADGFGGVTPAVTYNSVSMTLLTSYDAGGGNSNDGYMFYLINPSTGAHTVSVTGLHGGGSNATAQTASYTGAQQSGVPDASVVSHGVAAGGSSASVTTVINNCWVVGGVYAGGSPSGPGTTRHNSTQGSIGDSNGAISPAGSTSLSATWTGNILYTIILASFAPAITNITRTPSDSILIGASRLTTVSRIMSATRATAVSIMNGAGRLAFAIFNPRSNVTSLRPTLEVNTRVTPSIQ